MFNWFRQPGLASVRGEESGYGSVSSPAAATPWLIYAFYAGRISENLFVCVLSSFVRCLSHQGHQQPKGCKDLLQSMISFMREEPTRGASNCASAYLLLLPQRRRAQFPSPQHFKAECNVNLLRIGWLMTIVPSHLRYTSFCGKHHHTFDELSGFPPVASRSLKMSLFELLAALFKWHPAPGLQQAIGWGGGGCG